ncbi:DUF4124 domain-containing protein [Halopseudomonas phragmitis]|uniref:DUF4124 domain-containing protein n=1 Tax=Halopseudomonas phragmitis TaxID=1931241 RepID=A0A1V0B9F1_9GAMM|nr:DUF4124 domain-containing protein [Halopseudomonas phragmitis]AQZ96555.1 hypothetical protein BVH74_18155 [Halopseudomonas phragmitis]
MRVMAFFILLMVAGWAHAATVYRCEDAAGRAVFSQTPCSGSAAEEVQIRRNEIGGTLGPTEGYHREQELRRLSGERREIERRYERALSDIERGACREFNSTDLRTMIIKNQVVEGMTQADALRAWGRPSSVNGSQHAYHWPRGGSSYFYVRNGCVTTVQGTYQR